MDPTSLSALVLQARTAHRGGHLEEASALYRRALAASPENSEALQLGGACALAQGDVQGAIRMISNALRICPTLLPPHFTLAAALEIAGRVEDAIETCRRALLLQVDSAEAYSRLAHLLSKTGAYDQAWSHARVALALEPNRVEALCATGLALRGLLRYAEADEVYARAVALAPRDLRALIGRAALLATIDRTAEAEELYRRAAELAPRDVDILKYLAATVERGGDPSRAIEIYDRVLTVVPGSAEIHSLRAHAIAGTGNFDLAEAGFRDALRVSPDYAPAVYGLVRFKRYPVEDAPLAQLTRIIADSKQPAEHRVQAGFALGDVLDRAGDVDAAFRAYAEANRLHAEQFVNNPLRFNPIKLRLAVDQVEQGSALEYARDTGGWAATTDLPVFVVGMLRSGTTLVEQICASHSQVVGAGELSAIINAERAIDFHNRGVARVADRDPAFSRQVAEAHARELGRLAGGAHRVVDKAPLNVMRLGLIGALYPNARVIWCRRDPRDVVFSCHTTFLGQEHIFSDLRHGAHFYRQSQRMGAAWMKYSKLKVLEVVYEDLVADLDANVRRIIDFLGLDWEPECLEFHKTERRVRTPSVWQVRQPVYTSSIGRWRRYEKHLGPMFQALAEPA
jgi:tetratricopeptide (TPR) repeat protein